MNERIEELAQDCWSTSEYDTSLDPWFNHRKFAELIVQECVGVIEHSDLIGAKTEYYTKKIKQHFGVDQSAK